VISALRAFSDTKFAPKIARAKGQGYSACGPCRPDNGFIAPGRVYNQVFGGRTQKAHSAKTGRLYNEQETVCSRKFW
jgi:hypothetical protein